MWMLLKHLLVGVSLAKLRLELNRGNQSSILLGELYSGITMWDLPLVLTSAPLYWRSFPNHLVTWDYLLKGPAISAWGLGQTPVKDIMLFAVLYLYRFLHNPQRMASGPMMYCRHKLLLHSSLGFFYLSVVSTSPTPTANQGCCRVARLVL